VVVTIAPAAFLGWFGPERPWAEATGWEQLPPELRPANTAHLGELIEGAPRVHWLGHSGFLVEWNGRRILLDPNLSSYCTVARRVLERPVRAHELGHIDAALISHAHFDHLDLQTLLDIPTLGTIVVPRDSEDYVAELFGPLTGIVSLDVDQSWTIGDIEIIAVPAAHHGSRLHPLRSRRQAVGYILRSGGVTLYYAGDTGNWNDFAAIAERYQPRIAILPIGAYSPSFPIGHYHLDPRQAAEVTRVLGVDVLIPCHFGTLRLALDHPATALGRLAREARDLDVTWLMPRLLRPADLDKRINGAG
jgi:L-ascorbate metabolism protein UlaG (beta-lactamase superfamily)